MTLTAGTRLGPYVITAMLGAGGMGEVYRARDTRLQREVAIKILPEALAHDPDRLARFEREAQVLASLNHPNIAAIHGLEEATDGGRALVLELVEGDTLEDLLARRAGPSGPAGLPVDEALAAARQIIDALEAAHEAGVVHRDLKPANIKVTPAGHVKVLDFGLAKMREPVISGRALSQAPTITSPAMMTGVGMILGTAAYMSPEQARGKPVDRRADIWAFGCVLYEMLTGKRAFEGEDVTTTLARIMERELDFNALPAGTPASVRQALRLCLKKDPRERIQSIGDARLAMRGVFESEQVSSSNAPPLRGTGTRRFAELAAAAAVGVLGTSVAVWFAAAPPLPATRLTVAHPAPELLSTINQWAAISPDGRRLLYQAGAQRGQRRTYLRELDQLTTTRFGNWEDVFAIFFSPDGQWVGFVDALSGGSLKKMPTTGGPTITICRLPTSGFSGASWGDDDTIIFSNGGQLWRVNAGGGTPEPLTGNAGNEQQQGEGAMRIPTSYLVGAL